MEFFLISCPFSLCSEVLSTILTKGENLNKISSCSNFEQVTSIFGKNSLFSSGNESVLLTGEISFSAGKKQIQDLATRNGKFLIMNASFADTSKTFQTNFKAVAKVVNFPLKATYNESRKAIMDIGKKNNIVFDGQSVDLMMSSLSPEKKDVEVDAVHLLVNKLFAYTNYSKKKIEISDVFPCIFDSGNFSAWDTFDAIDRRDFNLCQELASRGQRGMGVNEFFNAFIIVFLWRYRLMNILKSFSNEKEALDFSLKMPKKTRSGTGLGVSYTLEKDGKMMYNDYVVRNMVYGKFGSESVLNLYSKKDLQNIYISAMAIMKEGRISESDIDKKSKIDSLLWISCNRKGE
jgi:DNA polymerase III delta subunit